MDDRKAALIERRRVDVDMAELRVEPSGDEPRRIVGYAAVFDAMSQPIFGFREVIRKGAFRKSIRDSDVRALWNHDPNYVLGRKQAQTLRMREDEKGLAVTIFPPDTQWAKDLQTTIERGDVSQMSFGFRTIKDQWTGEPPKVVRELLEVQLFDVSPVTFPAYPQTEVSTRAMLDYFGVSVSGVIFESLGVSPDQLAALVRAQLGGPLSEEDRSSLSTVREVIDDYFSKAEPPTHSANGATEPGNETHSAEARRDLSVWRKRLALATL
jgi:HK97 family phage prohead protease